MKASFLFSVLVLESEPRASHLLDTGSTTELHTLLLSISSFLSGLWVFGFGGDGEIFVGLFCFSSSIF